MSVTPIDHGPMLLVLILLSIGGEALDRSKWLDHIILAFPISMVMQDYRYYLLLRQVIKIP